MSDERKTAVVQFEFDRARMAAMTRKGGHYERDTPAHSAFDIIRGCLQDVFENGGTLVCVVGPKTITVVQRPMGSDDLENAQ